MEIIRLLNKKQLEISLTEHLKKRELPDKFLYTGISGAGNWLKLESSNDFTVASSLTTFLNENKEAIINELPEEFNIVSIGCGDAKKEKVLLKACREKDVTCHLVDVSLEMLEAGMTNMQQNGYECRGFAAEIDQLETLNKYWRHPVVLCLLGNNFCNYEPDYIFELMENNLKKGDYFLFDCETFTEDFLENNRLEKIKRAYRCSTNIQFNLSPLINLGISTEDIEFQLDLVPEGEKKSFKTRKQIKIKNDCSASLNGEKIIFKKGEKIRMGFTYKYDPKWLRIFLERSFDTVQWHVNKANDKLIALVKVRDK